MARSGSGTKPAQWQVIELGGNLGTWQGLGWAGNGDADSESVVGVGIAAGLAGIGAAALMTSNYEFREGHAALTAAGMPWGAWFGLVAAVMADDDSGDSDYLPPMLIGSDLLVLTAGILARDAEMSEKRVRVINLVGVIGGVIGGGVDLIAQPDDSGAAMAIVGVCSAAGLAAGFHMTKGVDDGEYTDGCRTGMKTGQTATPVAVAFQFPQVSVQPNLMTGRGVMPAVGARLTF